MHKIYNFFCLFKMFIFPNAHIAVRNSSFGRNGGCLLNNQCRTAHCTASQMNEMEIICKPVHAAIHAHWRDDHSVFEGCIFYFYWGKEKGHFCFGFLGSGFLGFWVLGFWVLGFWVLGSGFLGSGFWVLGFGFI